VKFGQREISKIVHCLLDKKKQNSAWLFSGSRPKSARASPRQYTQSAPDFIQIGSLSAEL